MVETFHARLTSVRLLTPRVRELVLERVDGAPFRFAAGQWVSLALPLSDAQGRPVRRVYSVASAPDGSPRFELIVTKVDGGQGSTWLHALEPGATLEVRGPQGTFTRPLALAAPSLFVATGSGVAPFRAMIRDALRAERVEPMLLVLGVRGPADALYSDELAALATAYPCLRTEWVYSRPPADWAGRKGYVQRHVRELWEDLRAQRGGRPMAYVCGVRPMLEATRVVLREELELERARVRLEAYS